MSLIIDRHTQKCHNTHTHTHTVGLAKFYGDSTEETEKKLVRACAPVGIRM